MRVGREILKGFVDIHVHAGPSIATRELDAADLIKVAGAAGYRAVVVKDHYFPTVMSTRVAQKHFGDETTEIFGSIVLNNALGLFNLKAVDTAYNMGAKILWFPTVSSKNHIDSHKGGKFPGSGSSTVAEVPVVYVDEKGVMNPDAVKVLEYMAENDMALGTGHGSAWEVDHLIHKAFEIGIKRVLVSHPHFLTGASYQQMAKWAEMGAYIEFNVSVFSDGAKLGPLPWEVADRVLEAVPLKSVILNSDLGQAGNGCPVEGMYNFIQLLMQRNGLTAADIELIGKTNPSALIGIG